MLALLWILTGCLSAGDSPPDTLAAPIEAAPSPVWPAAGAVHPLDAPPGDAPKGHAAETGGGVHLVLDAGHGAEGNGGNTNVNGEREQDVMRRVADGVAAVLDTDGVRVSRTRPDATLVSYDRRLGLANEADLLISLHSDARAGETRGWVNPVTGTWWTGGAAGFAVLWSDEGSPPLVASRRALARSLARHLTEAGFLPYTGVDYVGLYAQDDGAPGVFVDRHTPRQRIRLLRRPVVPSVIIETHEAHDRDEVARWDEPATWQAFASAVEATVGELR